LFVTEGVLAARRSELRIAFLCLQGPLMILLLTAFISIAHGLRIRTDVAPSDGISTLSDLPVAVRILADAWIAGPLISIVAASAVWSLIRVYRGQREPCAKGD
jgi:hypothetical protein